MTLYAEFSVDGELAGKITSELTVEYDGMATPAVERYVEEVQHRHLDGDIGRVDREVFDEIVVELPVETPVTAVQVCDDENPRWRTR